ncbi:MAG: nuclease family protein [Bryobacterales bacterium]|nr:nuclease family protein [Bryobacterales bacterium]
MRLSIPGVSTRLNEHSTLVTSSPVQAAVASQQFARSELDRGKLSWRRPAIYSLDAWLTASWQEARYASPDLPSLLSPAQELLLWEKVIESSAANLFDVSATARLAREALRLAVEWQIPLSDEAWNTHEDAQQFHRWQAAFGKQCQSNGWMTRSDAMRSLPSWIQSSLCPRDSVIFAGFHAPSPSLSAVFETAGTLLPTGPQLADERSQAVRHPVKMRADFRGELEAAARWARAQIEADPRRSLGIFLPGLPEHRSRVERTFRSVFYPRSGLSFVSKLPADDQEESIFHINRAQSLYEHPIVANALLLLELARPRVESSEATAVLRSPFISGASQERDLRALADLSLRRLRELDVSLRDLEYATRSCPLLTKTWTKVREVLRSKPHNAELSGWSRFFGDLVQAAGWPGDIKLTAAEQQVVEGWKDSLSALATLGLVAPSVKFESAVNRLKQILGAGGIQRGDWYSPVQILDALDAPGLQFDCTFVAGLSEQMWPPALRTSPLIPLQLQREHNLPNSTPALLQSERLRLTEALFCSSNQVFGTYTERLSPLAAPYCKVVSEPSIPAWEGKLPVESFVPATLDQVVDTQGPPFDVTRDVIGGTSIIKAQSLCPFRAFAEIRLRAQLPEDACFGFDSRDRGGFLHKALQYVWEELKTSDALNNSTDEALGELVYNSVRRAVTEVSNSAFHSQTTQVERKRLEQLLLEWLTEVEKARKLPFTVEQTEDEIHFNLAGLPLRLRVDRLDRLRGGGILLIDYKSGSVAKTKLDCPRPSEPQLLVYASAKNPKVEGMLFGQVRARDVRLVGKARDRHTSGSSIAVMGDKWDDFIAKAEQEVQRLASEFLRGEAMVDPSKEACTYCNNKPLCRVNEKQVQAEEEA